MIEFIELAKMCAPNVHPTTVAAIVRHESRFDPWVINVNGKQGRVIHPSSRQEAIKTARALLSKGASFDAGYGQINSRNWDWLGITPDTAFDPCTNLGALQAVLVKCYEGASSSRDSRDALYAALSCYNTGNYKFGFQNGYVGKVLAGAGYKVPALSEETSDVKPSGTRDEPNPEPPATRPPTSPEAFNARRTDAFSQSRPDAFAQRLNMGLAPVGSIIYHRSAPR